MVSCVNRVRRRGRLGTIAQIARNVQLPNYTQAQGRAIVATDAHAKNRTTNTGT